LRNLISVYYKDEFRREVEKQLAGRETELHEIVYFKLYKSQIPVIEQALETAALMLGTDKSRGYCLEMICADFLVGTWTLKTRTCCYIRFPGFSGSCRLPKNKHSSNKRARGHHEDGRGQALSSATRH
jgi:hypothetical protein